MSLIRLLHRGYKWTLSPLLVFIGGPGSGCRFEPSCSDYALGAVETHGWGRGSWMVVKRIARCQPWGGVGYDPVPAAIALGARASGARGLSGGEVGGERTDVFPPLKMDLPATR